MEAYSTEPVSGMQRWIGKVALITGVSSGVGKETARRLLQNGVKVVGCGRRKDALQDVKDEMGTLGELMTVQCDVAEEEEVKSMFASINSKYGGVEICINNAGLSKDCPILSGSSEDWQTVMDVNVMGLLRVTRESVASMKSKGAKEGHIININSLSGHRVLPYAPNHVYSASKHAVTAITQGTRNELLSELPNLLCRVSQISPGLIQTPFVESAVGAEKAKPLFSGYQPLKPEDIAEIVISQLSLPQTVQVQDVLVRSIFAPN